MNRSYFLSLVAVALVASASTWWFLHPAPPPPIDGIACQSMEGQALHYHVQVQFYVDGKAVPIPTNVGMVGNCFYWLHTHTADGIVHIESPEQRDFTLGQFVDIWGKDPLSGMRGIKVYVKARGNTDFHEAGADWRAIRLDPHEVIALGTGDFVPRPFTFPEGF